MKSSFNMLSSGNDQRPMERESNIAAGGNYAANKMRSMRRNGSAAPHKS